MVITLFEYLQYLNVIPTICYKSASTLLCYYYVFHAACNMNSHYLVITIIIYSLCIEFVASDSRNPIYEISKTNFKVFWNVPTFQCKSFKLNFTDLTYKYGIFQNKDDSFFGDVMTILYDPGLFPAILNESINRNGGVPQKGNLRKHLAAFRETLKSSIPDKKFSGLGVIDFEQWRPVFRQNFGTLTPYKERSIEIERNRHPFWPDPFLKKEAARRFELFGRQFMEETILLAKELRPKASWGYYAYPYCYNMSPKNMRLECPTEVQAENNGISWLFNQTDIFNPSIYLSELSLSPNERLQLIEGRILECHRLKGYLGKKHKSPKIYPYFWYKYQDTRKFLTKDDLLNTFLTLSSLNIDGLIIWGSSQDVNGKAKCKKLYRYIDEVLGPALVNALYAYYN